MESPFWWWWQQRWQQWQSHPDSRAEVATSTVKCHWCGDTSCGIEYSLETTGVSHCGMTFSSLGYISQCVSQVSVFLETLSELPETFSLSFFPLKSSRVWFIPPEKGSLGDGCIGVLIEVCYSDVSMAGTSS